MAGEETILQHWILTKFILPFAIVFFVLYAILEKTKLLGEDKHQLNAILSLVVALVFTGTLYPKIIVSNMVVFLTVALIVAFVGLILWGFVSGSDLKESIFGDSKGLKWAAGIVIIAAVIIALLWATGIQGGAIDLLFRQEWSENFWTNVVFIGLIVLLVGIAYKSTGGKSGGGGHQSSHTGGTGRPSIR